MASVASDISVAHMSRPFFPPCTSAKKKEVVGGGGGLQAWLWSEFGALPAGLDVKNAPVWVPYGVLTGGKHGCAIRGKTQISRFH